MIVHEEHFVNGCVDYYYSFFFFNKSGILSKGTFTGMPSESGLRDPSPQLPTKHQCGITTRWEHLCGSPRIQLRGQCSGRRQELAHKLLRGEKREQNEHLALAALWDANQEPRLCLAPYPTLRAWAWLTHLGQLKAERKGRGCSQQSEHNSVPECGSC